MAKLLKFLHLPVGERRLLIGAAIWVSAVRMGLWLLPLRTLQRLLAHFASEVSIRAPFTSQPPAERIAWAVQTISRFIPQATCLTQALAAQMMLARSGYIASLHIGVTKNENGCLEAHAWLESQDKVLVGESQYARFTPLVVFDRL